MILFTTPGNDCKLCVSRIHPQVTQQDLEEVFSQFGLFYELRLFLVESEERPCKSLPLVRVGLFLHNLWEALAFVCVQIILHL